MSLRDRLLKNSTIKQAASLDESKFFNTETFPTQIPNLNIACSGSVDEGYSSGLLQVTGRSKHFKSLFSLLLASAYLKKYPDSVLFFADSEFGSSKSYFESVGIQESRVIHCPVMNIEELKFELVQQLESLTRGDRVFFLIDSVGNLASKKEVEDAKDQKSVADMTRAKALASLFRIVTPYLKGKDVPLVVINHVYQTQEMFSKTVVSGGEKIYLSSNDIWIITRAQEKEDDAVAGWTFTINIEKSRKVKEKSKIPITVMMDGGIRKHSGLLDLGREMGWIATPTKGWYSKVDQETGEVEDKKYRLKEINSTGLKWFDFMLTSDKFKSQVKDRYQYSGKLVEDDTEEEVPDYEGEA